jgi:hypothetical protein
MESCTSGKEPYRKRTAAERALRKLARQRTEKRRAAELQVYRCRFCPHWHIGHEHALLRPYRRR